MQIELEGTIIKVEEIRSGLSARSGNEWRRQDYVIETPGQYPRKCLFTVADGNIELFNLTLNQQVKVTLSIDAHEYEGRWFNDFRCIGVASPAGQQSATSPAPAATADPLQGNPNGALPWEN